MFDTSYRRVVRHWPAWMIKLYAVTALAYLPFWVVLVLLISLLRAVRLLPHRVAWALFDLLEAPVRLANAGVTEGRTRRRAF